MYILIVAHHELCYVSDASPDTFPLNIDDLSLTEFTYDLSTNRRITPGIQTEISLSAFNELGNSNYSNTESITIPVPSNVVSIDGL